METLWDVEQYAYAYLWPFVSMALNMTIWLTVLITIHRYIVVCYPLSVAKYVPLVFTASNWF